MQIKSKISWIYHDLIFLLFSELRLFGVYFRFMLNKCTVTNVRFEDISGGMVGIW